VQSLLFWLGLATPPALVLLVFATLFMIDDRRQT
jgi:hypothetical protein